MIGPETRFFVCAQYQFSGWVFKSQSQRRVFPLDLQNTTFRQTTV